MPDKPWKVFERHTAEILGGQRIPRGKDFSQALPDVVAIEGDNEKLLIAECKYRATIPWLSYVESILKEQNISAGCYPCPSGNNFLVFDLKCFHEVKHQESFMHLKPRNNGKHLRRVPGIITDALEQALSYSLPDLKKELVRGGWLPPPLPEEFSAIAVFMQKGKGFKLGVKTAPSIG